MKNNILKITLGVAMIAALATACKKENGTPAAADKVALSGEKAVIPVNGTVAGTVTNTSASPTSWTAVGYDLHNNVTATPGVQVQFDSNFNGNITILSGYYLGYYDSPSVTNVTGITVPDLGSVSMTTLSTLGSNSATVVGWYDYNRTTRTITPVAKRYAVVADANSVSAATRLYVVQLDAVTPTGTTGPFTTTVNFHIKRLR